MKRIVMLLAVCIALTGQVCLAAGPQFEVGKEHVTKTGLKITILKAGSGNAIKSGESVSVNYTGWLYVDGKKTSKFDSSLNPGRTPFSVVLGQGRVIQGWEQGIVGMQEGEKRQLIIPGDLGYGERGSPPRIPANATLLFEVDRLGGSGSVELAEGEGVKSKAGDFVTLRFVGKDKATGKVFVDRSKDGYRYALGAQMFLPAWDKHVVGMKVGGKRKITLVSHEIYCGQGVPNMIEAGSDAEFEVELVKIEAGVTKITIKEGAGRVAVDGDSVRYHFKFSKDSLLGEVVDTRTEKRNGGEPLVVKLRDSDVFNPMMYLLGMKAGEVKQVELPWQWGALLAEPRNFTIELTLVDFDVKPAKLPVLEGVPAGK